MVDRAASCSVMAPFERFTAWQHSHRLVVEVYRATGRWPVSERFGLAGQVRRAAVSIPTNIAEGSAKRGSREFRRYLDIALGSLAELTYLLRLACDLGYLEQNEFERVEQARDEAGRHVWRLYESLRPPPS